MAFPKFDPKKHPHGFHGHFARTGGAAALFGMGASKARLQLATKKPMAPLPPELRGIKVPRSAAKATTARAVMAGASRGGAAAVMAGGSKTPHQHIEALRGLRGSAATDYAAGIKGKELDAVLQHAGLSRSGTVAAKRERLIGHAHGVTKPAPPAKAAAKPSADLLSNGRAMYGTRRPGESDAAWAKRVGARVADVRKLEAASKSAASVMAKPGSARAMFAAGSTKRLPNTQTPAEAAKRLNSVDSPEAAHAYLAKATKADLAAIADHAGLHYTKSATKPQLRDLLVNRLVNARQTSAVISKPSPSAHMSDEPLKPNTWGTPPKPGEIHFHDDGAIGTAIKQMGSDAHLEIEGHALANVLGHVATDTVQGRLSAEQQIERLRQIRKRLPPTSQAARELTGAIEKLTAPDTGGAPTLPDVVPKPLHQLATELHAVPIVRRDPRVMTALQKIGQDFAAGRTGGGRLLMEVQHLLGHYHESQEGAFEVRRAVMKAMAALEAMRQADRKSLYPPGF